MSRMSHRAPTSRPLLRCARTRTVSLVLVASLGLASARASAEPPSLSTSLAGEAKASFDAANLLYDDHDYAGASTKYRAAYAASQDARVLWNVAACEKELRHYARAAAFLDRFLRDAAPIVSPAFLGQAKLTREALRAFYGPLSLVVLPVGSRVLIDGEDAGPSPLPQEVPLDLGRHAIRVEHEGFAPYEDSVEIVGQIPVILKVTLKPAPYLASLVVTPSETEDTVSVDGKVVGGGPWSGQLEPGKHSVRISADGKQPYVTEIDLARGEHRSIDVTLEKHKKGAALWPWLVGGGAVLVAGGAVGTYFLFKPSDTSGPPPVGALGTVYLSSERVGGRRR